MTTLCRYTPSRYTLPMPAVTSTGRTRQSGQIGCRADLCGISAGFLRIRTRSRFPQVRSQILDFCDFCVFCGANSGSRPSRRSSHDDRQ